jgi:hypothetical protein
LEDELYDKAQAQAIVIVQAALRRSFATREYRAAATDVLAGASACIQSCVRRRLAMAMRDTMLADLRARQASIVLQSAARRMLCARPYEQFRQMKADPYFPPLPRTPPKSSKKAKERGTPDDAGRYGLVISEPKRGRSLFSGPATCELPPLVARSDTPVRKLRDPTVSIASSRSNSTPSTRNATPAAQAAPARRQGQALTQPQTRMVKKVVQAFSEPKKNPLPLPAYDPVRAGARLQARAQARAKLQQNRMQEEAASRTSDMSKFQEAEMYNRESLAAARKTKGPEHQDTLLIARNLVASLSLQGKFAEAEVLEREVLNVRKKTLGPEHPDTLTSAGNLAALLSCQGKVSEANTMNREVLAVRRRLSTMGPGRSASITVS